MFEQRYPINAAGRKVIIQTLTQRRTPTAARTSILSRFFTGLSRLSRLKTVAAYLTVIVLFALILRMAVVFSFSIGEVTQPSLDHNDFGWEMGWTARSLALGQGFSSPFWPTGTGPTALVPPLFPFLLSLIFRVFGLYSRHAAVAILTFNSICSALTCVPLYFLVRNAVSDRVARIASFAWAIYPFAIYFSAARVWDYALTALLFTCTLLAAQKLHLRGMMAWIGIGLLAGVTILSNPAVITLLPFLLLIALYKVWTVDGRWVAKGLLAVLAFTAVCTPWNVRNQHQLHSSFFMRDGFWLEFYAGNNGDTTESNSGWAHPASNPVEMQKYKAMGEIAYIAEKRQFSLDFVSHHPGFIVVATARRIVRFWTGYWSFSRAYLRYDPLDVPCLPFCLFLLWAMLRGLRRFWADIPGQSVPFFLAVLILPVPYYLTHSSMDYRQPLEPVIVILVTIGLFGTREFRAPTSQPAEALEISAV